MLERYETPLARTVGRILAACAWLTLGLVIAVGVLGTDPTFSALIRIPGAVLVVCLWGAAIWYEWLDIRIRSVPKWLILLLLIFGNFVAAFFYYFLFVVWRRPHSARKSAS
jgi:hypothetical protein